MGSHRVDAWLPMRWARRAGALLLFAGTALAAPGRATAPPAELLHVRADDPLVVRFGTAVRSSRVGSQSFRIVADGTNVPARGQYVAGTFLRDRTTGETVVVDPDVYRQAIQARLGLDRDAARRYVERVIARHEATGGRSDLDRSRRNGSLRDALRYAGMDARLNGPNDSPYRLETISQYAAATSAPLQTIRLLTAGDDALWAAHMAGDVTAFPKLAADSRFERFWHAVDPATGIPRPESEMRRREHRRVLFTRGPNTRKLTFVPDVPQSRDLTDPGLTIDTRYDVVLSRDLPGPLTLFAAFGNRLAIHGRTAAFRTANADDTFHDSAGALLPGPYWGLSELAAGRLHVVDVTPPNGETLVDPTTDWENPDDRHHVALADRRPFRVRVRFDKPLQPQSVNSASFTISCVAVAVGTANERAVDDEMPRTVVLRQTRLGAVEVELTPALPLEPAATYEVDVGRYDLVASLTGDHLDTDWLTTFTTAPATEDAVSPRGVVDDFRLMWNWTEADVVNPRPLKVADAAHDPDARGLFVPFLGADPAPVAAIESVWINSGTIKPSYTLVFDDPATPALDGTSIHLPADSNVRILIDSAPRAYDGTPLVIGRLGWQTLDAAHPTVAWSDQFFRLRIEFTLPPGATPTTLDLPSVDRLTVRAERP